MDFSSTHIPFRQTGYFSGIVCDYLDEMPSIQPFYHYPITRDGFREAMARRDRFATPRALLVNELKAQYAGMPEAPAVAANIDKLLSENCYTITAAHQPAIFTGNLYFVYKILHAIKIAEQLRHEFPDKAFVPVFWMGSEDADLDELGHIYLNGERLDWETKQTGAVGKMKTRGLDQLLARIEGELMVQPFGPELMGLLRQCYTADTDIQTATFRLLHALFGRFGLVVIIPDTPNLKRIMTPVFEDDLFNQKPSQIVSETAARLSNHYKVQAHPRDINVFYLQEGARDRIQALPNEPGFFAGQRTFSPGDIRRELEESPERFSPNVILRGLYQASLLPDIAFVGGGGETAYWFELGDLFRHYEVPFPVLVLRNSFLVVNASLSQKIKKLGFLPADFFNSEQQLLAQLAIRNKNGQLQLQQELDSARELYHRLGNKAAAIDSSLKKHVDALQARALKPIMELEKKLLRAEKRKYSNEERQIRQVRDQLFPHNGLQERVENFLPFYAKWGFGFLEEVYKHSPAPAGRFIIMEEIK